jgi:hypothetical protein
MKLNNTKRAGWIKMMYMLIPLLVVIAAAAVYLLYEVKDLRYMVLAFIVLLLFFAVMSIFKYSYIVFSAGPDNIQIRFKTLSPFNTPNNSVKIKSENFRNYEIKSSHFGLRKTLFLYQKSSGGLAKYPGIGFTALKEDQISEIKKAFDLILAINKSKKE